VAVGDATGAAGGGTDALPASVMLTCGLYEATAPVTGEAEQEYVALDCAQLIPVGKPEFENAYEDDIPPVAVYPSGAHATPRHVSATTPKWRPMTALAMLAGGVNRS
jgi:hypothetical protein